MASEPKIFLFVHPAYTDQIAYTQTTLIWESFARCGAIVMYGDDFKGARPDPGDHLVVYGRPDAYPDVVARFAPERRWQYVVDESNSSSGPYDKALSVMALTGVKNIIVTYQNSGHLQKLDSLGVRYLIMPQCMPAIRPRVEKKHDILISGQVSDSFYPLRTRTIRLLQSSPVIKEHIYALETPGQDISTARHRVIRDKYYDLLDVCRMGVVCRAAHRDRFVAKYVEMGACHMLPIGDCPTYMPEKMKRAMVDVEGMSPDEIIAELRRLLAAQAELQERTDEFTSEVARLYTALPNMQRVVSEMKAL